MQQQQNIIDCYDKTAEQYANQFLDELESKHFDRMILTAFCQQNIHRGKAIDFGCGPGQTTKFLFDNGLTNIVGTDLSAKMVAIASSRNPKIKFEQADLLKLEYDDESFGSASAFYAIVHFDYDEVRTALTEVKRVLVNDGEFLFSFHIGDEIVHLQNFLDQEVDIKFKFFKADKINEIISQVGFKIIDFVIRKPYEAEHQTERAYVWLRK